MAITSASQADDVGSIPIARSTFRLHDSLRMSRLVEGGFFVPCAESPGSTAAQRVLARTEPFSVPMMHDDPNEAGLPPHDDAIPDEADQAGEATEGADEVTPLHRRRMLSGEGAKGLRVIGTTSPSGDWVVVSIGVGAVIVIRPPAPRNRSGGRSTYRSDRRSN